MNTGSGIGLLPDKHQAIIWTNVNLALVSFSYNLPFTRDTLAIKFQNQLRKSLIKNFIQISQGPMSSQPIKK